MADKTPGKPVAATKDPDTKGFFLTLNIDTQAEAAFLVTKHRKKLGIRSVSELAQKLLADWVAEHRSKE